jgi:calcium-dependent protein kinase
MKVLDKKELEKKNIKEKTAREIMIHRQLKSPHIAELLHSFDDDQNIYIILEYCDGIELYKEIKQHMAY